MCTKNLNTINKPKNAEIKENSLSGCNKFVVLSCGEVQLISFEIFEQNIVKTANFDKYMANFVKIINTLQFSSQAAKKLLC